ncbi:hypothetical protein RCH10_005419 [Variovorax sp. GrIS 2.14]|uniref:hypothetical protein n=1 Tax=Variovorax sp. GrIS 2.14 TaxID=3071709 RepID=UPI0038F6BE43
MAIHYSLSGELIDIRPAWQCTPWRPHHHDAGQSAACAGVFRVTLLSGKEIRRGSKRIMCKSLEGGAQLYIGTAREVDALMRPSHAQRLNCLAMLKAAL